jgi:hypothetical protein
VVALDCRWVNYGLMGGIQLDASATFMRTIMSKRLMLVLFSSHAHSKLM